MRQQFTTAICVAVLCGVLCIPVSAQPAGAQSARIADNAPSQYTVQKGDTLYITEGPQGIRLVPFDEEFSRQMETAREIMRENRDVLQRLAE